MTCYLHKGLLLLGITSLISTSLSRPRGGGGGRTLVGFDRRPERLFLLSPSLILILFQPLLWTLIVRCRLPVKVLKAQSDVSSVVGGVKGSPPGVVEPPLSSVSASRSAASVVDDDRALIRVQEEPR